MNKLLSASDAPVGAAAAAVVLGAVAALLFFLPILSIPLGCCGVLFGVAGIVWALGRDVRSLRGRSPDWSSRPRRCASALPSPRLRQTSRELRASRCTCNARTRSPTLRRPRGLAEQRSRRCVRGTYLWSEVAGNRPTSGVANPQLVAMLTSAAGRTVCCPILPVKSAYSHRRRMDSRAKRELRETTRCGGSFLLYVPIRRIERLRGLDSQAIS